MKSSNIHDMIQNFQLSGTPDQVANRILDILDAMNERMNEINQTNHDTTKEA